MSLSYFMADSWKKCTDSECMVFRYPPGKGAGASIAWQGITTFEKCALAAKCVVVFWNAGEIPVETS